jgi:hypothetical protein
MMTVRTFIKVAERWAIDNAPTVLTAFGVTGTLATAYLTGKATFKAAEIIQEERVTRDLQEIAPSEEISKSDKAKLVWKCYIPPAISVVTTVGCVVAANTISMSRAAALAAGMAVLERNLGEYKDKVQEVFGEKKANEVRASIAEDAVNKTPVTNVERGHGGDTLCLDKWTGRYFTSDMQTIRATENDLNKGLFHGKDVVVTLGDFYQALGLSVPKCAEEVGWNADASLDLVFDAVNRDGEPVLVMDFANTPFPINGVFGHP